MTVLVDVVVVVVAVWKVEVFVVVVEVFTVLVCVVVVVVGGELLSEKTIWPLLFDEHEPKFRLLVSPVYPVVTHDGTKGFPL